MKKDAENDISSQTLHNTGRINPNEGELYFTGESEITTDVEVVHVSTKDDDRNTYYLSITATKTEMKDLYKFLDDNEYCYSEER